MIKEEERRNKEIKLQNNNDNTIYVTNKKEFLNNISIKEKRKKIRVNNSDKIIKSNENLKKLKPKFSKSKSFISLNKYECHNIEKLKYDLTKDYNQLHINKDENFMERMKFDIYKRQIREERINNLIEKNKIKIDEENRIKAFNRLIEDANRRFEVKENLEIRKNKLKDDIDDNINVKKYNEYEWKEIYNNRFINFEKYVNNKIKLLKDKKKQLEKKIEDEEINKCKSQKCSKKQIEDISKRLYQEFFKRKIKLEGNNYKCNNYVNDSVKYKKTIKSSSYYFIDDEHTINNYSNKNQSKKTNKDNSEFKNLKFDFCYQNNNNNLNEHNDSSINNNKTYDDYNNILNDKDFINLNNNKKDCNRILNLKLDINNMNKTFNEIKKRNKSTSKKNINYKRFNEKTQIKKKD